MPGPYNQISKTSHKIFQEIFQIFLRKFKIYEKVYQNIRKIIFKNFRNVSKFVNKIPNFSEGRVLEGTVGQDIKRVDGGGEKTNLIGSQIFFKNFPIYSNNSKNVSIILANNLKDYPQI